MNSRAMNYFNEAYYYKGELMNEQSCEEKLVKSMKPMSPVLEHLVDYAYRAGSAETSNQELLNGQSKLNRYVHDLEQKNIQLNNTNASLESSLDGYEKALRECRSQLYIIYEKERRKREKARKDAKKKPMTQTEMNAKMAAKKGKK